MKKILIIDDDDITRELLAGICGTVPDVEVTTAIDGFDGLVKLMNNEFDLIFCDIHMPEMSGLEVAQAFRASNGRSAFAKFILMSGAADDQARDFREQAKALEVSFLGKPFPHPKSLRGLINSCLFESTAR